MAPGDTRVLDLLRRWHGGEQRALDDLLGEHLEWITDYVHGRLGKEARDRAETLDFVQASMLDFLRYGPRFEVSDASAFRGLFARIAENNIRDERRFWGRQKRAGERIEGSDSVLHLDARRAVTRPSECAQRNETIGFVRLALELLEPQDRAVLRLREFDSMSFAEIGEKLSLSEDAARMRFGRALPRLADKVAQLRSRGLTSTLVGS